MPATGPVRPAPSTEGLSRRRGKSKVAIVHRGHYDNIGLRLAGLAVCAVAVLLAAPVVVQRTVGPVCVETGDVARGVAGADLPGEGQEHCFSQ